jgi:hypothetical protein
VARDETFVMFLLRRGDARHIASLGNRLIKVFWISDVMAAPENFSLLILYTLPIAYQTA